MSISLADLNRKSEFGRDGRKSTPLTDELSWSEDDKDRIALRPTDRIRVFYDAFSGGAFIEKKTGMGWKRIPKLELDFEFQEDGMSWIAEEVKKCGATITWGNINNCPYGTRR